MTMLHRQAGERLVMFHYNATIGVNAQGGPRGVTKFESANSFMPEAIRRVGPGTLGLRGMLSFEPFTFAKGGSPLLFLHLRFLKRYEWVGLNQEPHSDLDR